MLEQLIGLKFPAYKSQIMDFLKKNSANHEMISLFETLNGNVVYRAQYHVKKAIKQKTTHKLRRRIKSQTREGRIWKWKKSIQPINVKNILKYCNRHKGIHL